MFSLAVLFFVTVMETVPLASPTFSNASLSSSTVPSLVVTFKEDASAKEFAVACVIFNVVLPVVASVVPVVVKSISTWLFFPRHLHQASHKSPAQKLRQSDLMLFCCHIALSADLMSVAYSQTSFVHAFYKLCDFPNENRERAKAEDKPNRNRNALIWRKPIDTKQHKKGKPKSCGKYGEYRVFISRKTCNKKRYDTGQIKGYK